MAKTRVLFIGGDDYANVMFERKYYGRLISEIIPELDLKSGEVIMEYDEPVNVSYEIKEFDVIADDNLLSLLQAVKDDSDYDYLKGRNYYPENHRLGNRYKY